MKGKWLKAILAAFCSFLCINFLCMFYRSAPGPIRRANGATALIHLPNSYFVNLTEGCGVIQFDKNGYNNPKGKLDNPYVLVMGSSHVEAVQIPQERNMTTILNHLLGADKNLKVYNIAHSGNFLPDIAKRFKAAINEFPDSSSIIIEVSSRTFYPVSDLQNSIQQIECDVSSSGEYLAQNLTNSQKYRSLLNGSVPFIKLMRNVQMADITLVGSKNPFGLVHTQVAYETEYDEQEYMDALNRVFALLRSEYEGPIIILYHPKVALSNNGLEIVRDKDTYSIFKNACEDNNIIFLDTGDAFLEAYEDDYIVPYGFNNTEMGYGHLNADGHKIIAQELYETLQGVPIK